MTEIISFVEKHLYEIKPVDYFLIIAVLLLSIPYIYKIIKKLFQERFESSIDLIKIKDEIINSQEKRTGIIINELDHYKIEIKDKTKKMQEVAKILKSLGKNQNDLSKLTKIISEYHSLAVNRVLAAVFVTFGNLSYFSMLKSMIVLYSTLNVSNTYPDAPSALTILDKVNEIEEKVTAQLPNLDNVSFKSILLDSDKISDGFAPDNLKLDFKQLDELVVLMDSYISKYNENS